VNLKSEDIGLINIIHLSLCRIRSRNADPGRAIYPVHVRAIGRWWRWRSETPVRRGNSCRHWLQDFPPVSL